MTLTLHHVDIFHRDRTAVAEEDDEDGEAESGGEGDNVAFDDGQRFELPFEYLRVYSPSAEVRGHGKPTLVTNKKQVAISKLLPVGHYAVKLVFDDGHDSGIYSWVYLQHLAYEQDSLWQSYLQQLAEANANRDSLIAVRIKH